MPTTLGWSEIALRLALTVVAGSLIGLNRGEHGRPRWAADHFAGLSRRVSGHDSDEPAAHDCRQDTGFVRCDGYNAPAFGI